MVTVSKEILDIKNKTNHTDMPNRYNREKILDNHQPIQNKQFPGGKYQSAMKFKCVAYNRFLFTCLADYRVH